MSNVYHFCLFQYNLNRLRSYAIIYSFNSYWAQKNSITGIIEIYLYIIKITVVHKCFDYFKQHRPNCRLLGDITQKNRGYILWLPKLFALLWEGDGIPLCQYVISLVIHRFTCTKEFMGQKMIMEWNVKWLD